MKRSRFLVPLTKYFGFQDVSKRSTVAVVVDDPEGKKQVSILSNIFRHLKFKKLGRFLKEFYYGTTCNNIQENNNPNLVQSALLWAFFRHTTLFNNS